MRALLRGVDDGISSGTIRCAGRLEGKVPALARLYPPAMECAGSVSSSPSSSSPRFGLKMGTGTGTPTSSSMISLALLAYAALGAGGGVRPSRLLRLVTPTLSGDSPFPLPLPLAGLCPIGRGGDMVVATEQGVIDMSTFSTDAQRQREGGRGATSG